MQLSYDSTGSIAYTILHKKNIRKNTCTLMALYNLITGIVRRPWGNLAPIARFSVDKMPKYGMRISVESLWRLRDDCTKIGTMSVRSSAQPPNDLSQSVDREFVQKSRDNRMQYKHIRPNP